MCQEPQEELTEFLPMKVSDRYQNATVKKRFGLIQKLVFERHVLLVWQSQL